MLPPFVCPRCRGALAQGAADYRCAPCGATYPVVAGIPDFRVSPDPWIGLEDDRAKALRLDAAIRGLDVAAAARTYWAMTPDTPPVLAARYVEHVATAPARSRDWLATLTQDPDDAAAAWLELGCGTGDLLAVARAAGTAIVGIDIALRWLVVARRRPELADGLTPLVCCCAEALPFPDGGFRRVVALGLLEHCADPAPVAREARRMLPPGGRFQLRSANRYSLLPEPHVRVWGVGFVPRAWADRYVRWRAGLGYPHHRPPSVREVRRALRASRFRAIRVTPARVLPAERARLSRPAQALIPLYAVLRRTPVARNLLAWVAPLLEATAEAV